MNIIKRYAAPNKMDQSPKGTICIVHSMLSKGRATKDGSIVYRELYEQISEDWENPVWVNIPDNPEVQDQ